MKTKLLAIVTPALALGMLALPAEAQQHRATRLGNPVTRFAKKLPRKPDDVRVLLRGEKTKGDVAAVLNEAGWKGNLEDLDRAAASAEIVEVEIAPGTRIPFMASRERRRGNPPHALMDVLWAGRTPIKAYAFDFTSNCSRYRVYVPKPCGNFWVEETGRDETGSCAPPPPPPVVSLSSPGEVCVTQSVEVTVNVQNPPADGRVSVALNGREILSGALTNGTLKATIPGSAQPGSYEVRATSGGVSSTTSFRVQPCLPACTVVVTPSPVRAGKPFTVDVTGSRVAAGVQGGIRSAKVDVVRDGAVVDSFELAAPALSRSDAVIKKSGAHTIRAVVLDEAGQASTNSCETPIEVKGVFPLFVGGYFGKERLTHDEDDDHGDRSPFTAFSRCSPLAGFQLGVQPAIGDNAAFEAAVGVKIPFDDDAHTTLFADAAINRMLSSGFFGGGVSFWDIGKDSSGVGLLLQAGFDLDKDGKWQLVGQTRVPFFNQIDSIDNNYQFWGGFRFRPFNWK